MANVKYKSGKGALDEYIKRAKKISGDHVTVGFHSSGLNKYENGDTVATNAARHEFGTDHIPARPFIRPSIRAHVRGFKRQRSILARKMLNGDIKSREALKVIGVNASDAVQEYIVSGSFLPLAASTIESKGSTKPLIDTGLMRQSVSFEVFT